MSRSQRRRLSLEFLEDRRVLSTITVAPVTVDESAASSGATFTATIPEASSTAVTLDYSTSNGSAKAGTNYVATKSSVTIPAGQTSATFTVGLKSATTSGLGNETFYVNLSTTSGNTVAAKKVAATIVDDLPEPTATILDLTVPENAGGGTTRAAATVKLSYASTKAVTVYYQTTDETATSSGSSADYKAVSGKVTIPAGKTSATIPLTIHNLATEDKTFDVTIDSVTNGTIKTPSGYGFGRVVIHDTKATATEPTLTISQPFLVAGNIATFTATISAASTSPVSFRYYTLDGTAVAGTDYMAVNNVATIPAGQTSAVITVPTIATSTLVPVQQFQLALSSPANVKFTSRTYLGTVVSTSALPTVSVAAPASVTAPTTGSTSTADFTVSLSTGFLFPVTVNYTTVDGTAVAGTNYTSTSGTLTFAPGVTSLTVPVTVLSNSSATAVSSGLTFSLALSSPTDATIATASATATITPTTVTVPVGNEPSITVTAPTAVSSPMPGSTASATFTVTLSAASTTAVTVDYATADGTAIAGTDYTATSGTLTFAPGVTSQTVTVPLLSPPGGAPTADTTFSLDLSSPTDATIATASATATISAGTTGTGGGGTTGTPVTTGITVAGGTAVVGTTGTSTITFTVSLSAASTSVVTVDYATADGTAVAGTDYTAASGTLTFAAGTTSQTVTVTVAGETTTSDDKTLTLNLTNATNATITSNSATGEILYATSTPSISVAATSATVPTTGTSTITFTVSLSGVSADPVTVNYATVDGTAVAGTDYTAATGTLTFASGVTSQTVVVTTTGESSTVTSKTFSLDLTAATNTSNATASAVGTLNYVVAGTSTDLSNNLSSTSGGTETATGTTQVAASFTTGTSAFTLSSVTLLLDQVTAGTATVAIYSDLGLQPGTLLETLTSPTSYSATLANATFTSAGTALTANTTYWVVLSAPTGSFDWSFSSDDAGTGVGFTDTWAESTDGGTTYFTYNTLPTQMQVVATANG